jgi:spermidine/putrescine transport system ATP-binding protein
MNRGVIEQIADGRTLYQQPRTAFVASFVGETNAFAGRIATPGQPIAEIDTEFGPLLGRNPRGLTKGSAAIAALEAGVRQQRNRKCISL